MEQRMRWSRLIDDKRYGLEDFSDEKKSGRRTDFRRDYDRLVFSSPFRRLQNKTQVFPLPGSIFVHNRLTHSLEVSSVGKSLADEIAWRIRNLGIETEATELSALEHIGDIVSAGCLAHDLGNPPFGHSGEKAISTYFSEGPGQKLKNKLSEGQWSDFTRFEGNANSFRLLTHQFRGRRAGGFAMTYSMIASIVKYPYESLLAGERGKFGFFQSERATMEKVASHLGMIRKSGDGEPMKFARHPLVYIVEAADDICYEVMDMEDAHKLKVLTYEEVYELFMGFVKPERREHTLMILSKIDDPNERIAYLRSCVVGSLVDACAEAFVENYDRIMTGGLKGSLLGHIRPVERGAMSRCNDLSWAKIYCARDVVDVELAGNRIITFLMDKFVNAVTNPSLNYSRLLLSQVPQQYNVEATDIYGRLQAVLDHVSGMTDVYALDLYRKLNGMSLPAV